MSFGNQIQFFRNKNGLTQEQLSEELGVSRQAVSKWESGKGYPEVDKIIYFCNKYEVPISELFSDEINPASSGENVPFQIKSLGNSLTDFYDNLNKGEKIIINVLLVCAMCCFLYTFGYGIGKAIYHLTN